MAGFSQDMNFECNGFHNTEITRTTDCLQLRTNVHSKEDFVIWQEIYCKRTNTWFKSKRQFHVGERMAFHEKFMCHHGNKRLTGKKKTYTG